MHANRRCSCSSNCNIASVKFETLHPELDAVDQTSASADALRQCANHRRCRRCNKPKQTCVCLPNPLFPLPLFPPLFLPHVKHVCLLLVHCQNSQSQLQFYVMADYGASYAMRVPSVCVCEFAPHILGQVALCSQGIWLARFQEITKVKMPCKSNSSKNFHSILELDLVSQFDSAEFPN